MQLSTTGKRAGFLSGVVLAAVLIAACTGKNPAELIGSAKDYLAKNDYNAAVIQLKNALQASPDNGEARLLLGRALAEQRDFAGAEKELRRALELGQAPDVALPLLARSMIEQDQQEKLVKEFGDRDLVDPASQALLRTAIGDAYVRMGKPKEAAAAYAAAVAARPGFASARLGQATVGRMAGDSTEAMKIVDEVISSSPKLAPAYALKGELLWAEGKRVEARKAFEQATLADAKYVPAHKSLAIILINERAFEQAAGEIDAARKLARGDLSINYLEGLLQFEKGDLQKARDNAMQVLKHAPDHVPTLVLAGVTELRLKQFDAGEAHLRKALSIEPNHWPARRLLGTAYLQTSRPQKALEVIQPMVDSGAVKDPQVMLLAGEAYLANSDVKQATAYFAAASQSGQAKVAAQTRLGQIALARGDTELGFQRLEEAAELDTGGNQADLALIAEHLRRGETDKALAAARNLEKKQPKSPLAQHMLGVVNLARKDSASARKDFEKALELQPTYYPAVNSLANLDLAERKAEQARKRFEDLIAKDPTNDQAYVAMAEVQARTGARPDEIAATLSRGIKAAPTATAPRIALIYHHLRERNNKVALQVAQEAAAAFPNDARVLTAVATAQEASGDINQAIETLNKLVNLQPKSPQPLMQLASLQGRQKNFGAAIDTLRRAQRLAPDDLAVQRTLVITLAAADRPDDAMKEAKAMQAGHSKSPVGHALEGDLHARQKQWAEAERAYRQALKLDPRSGEMAVKIYGLLKVQGKPADADAFAAKWMKDSPRDPAMRMQLATEALAAGKSREAFGLYQQVIAVQPDNAVALNNLAWVGGELGDARAIDYAERAVFLFPNTPEFLDTLGVLLVGKGDISKGLAYHERARTLAPDSAVLRLNYAKALVKAGRKDEARKELEALKATAAGFKGKEEIDGLLKSL